MRLFITNTEGTGGMLGPFPLDPPATDGEVVQSEYWQHDRFRPVGVVGAWAGAVIDGRGPQRKFLVVAFDVDVAPNGAYDLGDPEDPADMDRPLSRSEQRFAEQTFNVGNRTFDGYTLRQLAQWTVPHLPRFACALRGAGVTLFGED